MSDPRYPIGPFAYAGPSTLEERATRIAEIIAAPRHLRDAVQGLTDAQLDTPYREGGWTVRQVVHHLADSHVNAYVRFRLAATEDEPTIKPYEEQRWAELADARGAPIAVSLALLDALHDRWGRFLRSLEEAAFDRRIHHPESGVMSVDHLTAMYAWHGKHHVAHITELRKREGW